MPKATSAKPIRLAMLWHQHQPYYRAGNKFIMPWVWLHATKDYLEMAQHLEAVPAMKATINLVPSLIKQIEEYLSGAVEDPLITALNKRSEDLTQSEKQYIFDSCFHANYDRMIARSNRYAELHASVHADRPLAEKNFGTNDYRDLLVHYSLAWTGEFIRNEAAVAELIAKDRDYTEEDKQALLGILRERVAQTLSLHRTLAERGQIELSTTPFYHPIMPLLCDTNAGAVSVPGLALPHKRFREPDDTRLQLQRGREYFGERFNGAPKGIWPSEGSLSEEVLQIMIEQGVEWTATDEAILTRTLSESVGLDTNLPESNPSFAKYFPFKYKSETGEISIFFRDHALSDNIGFVYQSWSAEDATKDFIKHILQIRKDLISHYGEAAIDRACISVILDGENCWEYYPNNGYEFLKQLYTALSSNPEIEVCTMSGALEAIGTSSVPTLQKLTPGSWINANFNIWIGHTEDNLAWDELHKARCVLKDHESWLSQLSGSALEAAKAKHLLAQEELLIAEGSDWCWWYGDDHFSIQKDKFDELYRMHLRAVYVYLDKRVPDSLGESVMLRATREQAQPAKQSGPVFPQITGERVNPSWSEVDEIEIRIRHGSMHKAEKLALEEMRAEIMNDTLFIKLIPRAGSPTDLKFAIELKDRAVSYICSPQRMEIASTESGVRSPAIEYNWKSAMELAVHLGGLSQGRQPFAVTLSSESLAHSVRIPKEGWLLH